MKYCTLLAAWLLTISLSAEANRLHSLQALGTTKLVNITESRVLNLEASPDKPFIYILHNSSRAEVLFNRVQAHNPGVQAGWSSQLSPNHWSALILTQNHFQLSCQIKRNYSWQQVPCKKLVELYQLSPDSNHSIDSSYWMAENKSFQELRKELRRRGMIANH